MNDIVLMGDPRVADIPVAEVGDDLVDVREERDLRLDGLKETPEGAYAYLRHGLVERLLFAQDKLPGEYRLLLVEGYRPYDLQEHYFSSYRQELEMRDPELDGVESFQLASRYVSPPVVAPHVSAAAIDLTLVDGSGQQVDMETPVNASPEDSAGACYFGADDISGEARHHRQVLSAALRSAGLVNYPTEWWHWSFGDRYWALMTGRPAAIYGPVSALGAPA
ncbi:MAG: M15 family metallopeptidase [Nocardioidaceae bacterium]